MKWNGSWKTLWSGHAAMQPSEASGLTNIVHYKTITIVKDIKRK